MEDKCRHPLDHIKPNTTVRYGLLSPEHIDTHSYFCGLCGQPISKEELSRMKQEQTQKYAYNPESIEDPFTVERIHNVRMTEHSQQQFDTLLKQYHNSEMWSDDIFYNFINDLLCKAYQQGYNEGQKQ